MTVVLKTILFSSLKNMSVDELHIMKYLLLFHMYVYILYMCVCTIHTCIHIYSMRCFVFSLCSQFFSVL